ncbi:hypothetical protein FHG87_003330 [Trinorchestia longiramus]|nr:hypothetical protein FHG87_003330 [Trinorchestia longiramus]
MVRKRNRGKKPAAGGKPQQQQQKPCQPAQKQEAKQQQTDAPAKQQEQETQVSAAQLQQHLLLQQQKHFPVDMTALQQQHQLPLCPQQFQQQRPLAMQAPQQHQPQMGLGASCPVIGQLQDSRSWQEQFEWSAKEQRDNEQELEVVEVIVEKEVQDKDLLTSVRNLESENNQLLDKAARLEEQLNTARRDLAEQQQSAPSTAELEQLQLLQQENTRLQESNRQLLQDQKQLQELQEENSKLRVEKDKLQQVQEENKQLQEEKKQLQKLQEENKQLQEENKQLQKLQEENKQLQKLQEENKQLQKLQEENKQLDLFTAYTRACAGIYCCFLLQESLLTSLQMSVEHEEGNWLALVKTKEDKIEEITKENEKLSQQVLASSSADKLQAELERVKQEKADLQVQLTALSSKAAEVTSLRELLAEGVEAGKEQEHIIEQLQAELESTKGTCATTSNGPPSADATSDESESKQ